MRKPLFFLLGLSLMSQLFFACKKEEEKVNPTVITPANEPGYFVVSSMSRPSTANARLSAQASETEFELGPLRASKEFLFMIANGGDEAIFDVTLTSDNANFEVTPKTIKTVPGKNQTGIMPLLTLGVIHGRQLNGTATAVILSKGQNKATIKLTGKTISKKDTIEVTGEFSVSIEAKVFAVKFLSGDQEPTIKDTYKYMVSPSKGVRLVNTGNIKIRPKLVYGQYKSAEGTGTSVYVETINEFDLEPDQEKDITTMIGPNYDYYGGMQYSDTQVYINDEGVVRATPGLPNPYNPNVAYFILGNLD